MHRSRHDASSVHLPVLQSPTRLLTNYIHLSLSRILSFSLSILSYLSVFLTGAPSLSLYLSLFSLSVCLSLGLSLSLALSLSFCEAQFFKKRSRPAFLRKFLRTLKALLKCMKLIMCPAAYFVLQVYFRNTSKNTRSTRTTSPSCLA